VPRLVFVFPVLGLLVACAEPVASRRDPVVYGEDGRTEVYAHPNAALRAVAETAVAMKVDRDYVDATDPDHVVFDYDRTLGEAKDLCAGERFAEQIEPGTCSGTLIDERHLLTAGHCMDAAEDCTDKVWVFGFHYVAAGTLATLTSDDVYSCSRVLAYYDDGDVDHAVVELDRPVVGHTPAPVRVEAAGLPLGTGLALIGHPNGIPMKIDDGGAVTWNSSAGTHLQGTVDAFSGNSGSGVFDHEGQLVGLLYAGMDDYVPMGDCSVVNVIDPAPTDDGEEITYVRPALEAFCAEPGVDSVLCDCDGPCVPALPGDTCADSEVIEAVSQVLTGDMNVYAADTQGTCGGEGRDRTWTFTTDRELTFTARSSGYDSVLYLRAGCDGAEIACNDDVDVDTDRGSRIATTLPPGTYVLVLDAYDQEVDAFTLTLTFAEPAPPADLGTPVVDAGIPQRDAGFAVDAGPVVDAGAEPTPKEDDGCGCRTATPGDFPLPLALATLWFLRRRSR
tara:strand:- start:929 stop:2443 length:1515 start_codon:yes stop_codon:yes gene_type:complete